ncbi:MULTISPECIES: urease accessory protein UreD [unclassified Streptomyces]|uniref:urease accessory protein UreD n=1 Tax=unclassified Streptomyces TaxID=2593676 RepID=UPI00088AD980|nr:MULTISPECIES: urease accessory protein UreD [unclassified Streptomyces]PBC86741.1 urease accessory protein [Streptomyces sp. 2321.6]SDQ73881.1 urease accessory protein [Streptomyces sp. KS_16]SED46935.1 urease accessory protein [Streptomyces sp. 2112.3]SEE08022.1 urease accessory protein [Streptomyces sp. 2133.1]SNC73917.1 urease accessory protein [Streptomyces sp. 2114.4]
MTLALPTPEAGRAVAGLCATARIVARADGQGITRLPVLDGDGPFALRRIRGYGNQARVCVVGAMSAPLGGDRLGIEATAEAGSALHLTAAAATVALPGRTGEHARYDVWLTVGEGARLDWLPEPLISAAGSDLRMTTTVELAPTARLVLREEQVLGRSGEPAGALRSRLTVRRAGRTLLDQETAYGPGVPGWDTSAVLDGHRALGQLLVIGPEFEERPVEVRLLGGAAGERSDDGVGQGVLAPLAGPGALATAVAPDALRLRRLLDEAAGSAAVGSAAAE